MIDLETDLEQALEKAREVAEELGFMTVSNTNRTITLSPRDKSVLGGSRCLIFDISIMATNTIRQVGVGSQNVDASDLIKDEYCFVVCLNDEQQNRVFLFGIKSGLGVLTLFCQFIQDAFNHRLVDTPSQLTDELTRPIRATLNKLVDEAGSVSVRIWSPDQYVQRLVEWLDPVVNAYAKESQAGSGRSSPA
jgi:hypothetical protein